MPMSDVFVQIRNEYEDKTCPRQEIGPGHPKVLARNDECFITDLPDKWRVDYDRRLGHRHTGYFAYNHVPYVTFANLKHTDVYDLIGENVGITMQKHWHYMQMLHLTQAQRHDYYTNESDDSANTIVVVCDGTNKRRQSLPPSRNAGLSSIRVALGSNNRAMLDIAAGTSFGETTNLEEERGKYLKQLRTPKEVKRNGDSVSVSNPSFYLRPMVHTASSKTCLVSKPTKSRQLSKPSPDQSKVRGCGQKKDQGDSVSDNSKDQSPSDSGKGRSMGPNLYIALAAAHFKLSEKNRRKENQTLNLAKRKQQRECLAKLKSVYAILSCLHNIKMKDLRSREPMSFRAIKAMAQRPLHSLTKDYHHDAHHHAPHFTLNHHPSPILAGHSAHHLHHHHHGRQRNPKTRHYSLVETWEDLLQVYRDKVKGQSHTVTLHTPITAGAGTSGQTCLPRTGSKETAHQEHGDVITGGVTDVHHKPHRVLPPWQRQVVYVNNKDESLKRDPAKKLCECIESFHYFKSEMSQKVKSSLSERKQQLQKHLGVKLAHLDLGANSVQCLDAMRVRAYQLKMEERAEEDNKPLWYVLLEREVSSVFERRGDSEDKIILEKLKPFIMVDNDTLPHVLEKLCLLVMSLPANHLSIDSVFAAVQFVAEHILKSPPTVCVQWRDMRQLPPVTTELPDPAYLFGMHV